MNQNKVIVAWLKANKISQRVFAHRLGVTEATVSRIIRGTRRPSISLALAISRATGIAVEKVFK